MEIICIQPIFLCLAEYCKLYLLSDREEKRQKLVMNIFHGARPTFFYFISYVLSFCCLFLISFYPFYNNPALLFCHPMNLCVFFGFCCWYSPLAAHVPNGFVSFADAAQASKKVTWYFYRTAGNLGNVHSCFIEYTMRAFVSRY